VDFFSVTHSESVVFVSLPCIKKKKKRDITHDLHHERLPSLAWSPSLLGATVEPAAVLIGITEGGSIFGPEPDQIALTTPRRDSRAHGRGMWESSHSAHPRVAFGQDDHAGWFYDTKYETSPLMGIQMWPRLVYWMDACYDGVLWLP
jgi:hypothetical protein